MPGLSPGMLIFVVTSLVELMKVPFKMILYVSVVSSDPVITGLSHVTSNNSVL